MRTLLAHARLAAFSGCFAMSGCKADTGPQSAASAARHVDALVKLTASDVQAIERGVPSAAKLLTELYANGADPQKDAGAVHRSLSRVRRDVPDLEASNATFLALTDDHGIGIRNDLDIDLMAGLDLGKIFPALTKGDLGAYVETSGVFPSSPDKPGRSDKTWVAAKGVARDDATVGGIFVAGWSYRLFARHLYDSLRVDIFAKANAAGTPDAIPVFYVAVFDRSGVYSAAGTPLVDEQTLTELDLATKTSGGAFVAPIIITDRAFGVAAARAPSLGAETGIVVLRSEI